MADLYLDHDVSARVVPILQRAGLDVPTAHSGGFRLMNDAQQLWIATDLWNAPIVTYNGKDFRLLHQAWQLWTQVWGVSQEHAGILVLPHGRPEDSAQRVQTFLQSGQPSRNRLYRYGSARGWDLFV